MKRGSHNQQRKRKQTVETTRRLRKQDKIEEDAEKTMSSSHMAGRNQSQEGLMRPRGN